MNLILVYLTISIGIVSADWELVWEDDFDGDNMEERWNFEVDCLGGGNNELQCYTDNREENCRQEDGILHITALREDVEDGKSFTSTRIFTKESWLHGKFEIRARLPKGKHLWPAIWMLPVNGEWPKDGEIDIMEYKGQKPYEIQGNLHYGPDWSQRQTVGSEEVEFSDDFSIDFHTFGLDWNSDRIQWLVDDEVYHEESLQKNFNPELYTRDGEPFDGNFYLIINLAVGGNFFGDEQFDSSEADEWEKNNLEIDYVRKWEWR